MWTSFHVHQTLFIQLRIGLLPLIVVYKVPNLQNVGYITLLPAILLQYGADPASVLRAAGLDTDALNDKDGKIPFEAVGLLLEIAAERTQCPQIGLEIGSMIVTKTLGLIGQLMRNAPTVGDALLDLATHQHRNAHGGAVYLTVDEGHAFFGYAVYQCNVRGNQIICDAATTAAWSLVRELADSDSIEEILLSRVQPQNLEPSRFDAEQTGIRCRPSLLMRPIRGADPALRTLLAQRVAKTWHAGELDLLTQLRRALRLGIIYGHTSAIEVAEQLGVGRRTLQRRLDEGGFSFQQLLDEARFEYAQQLLAGTRLNATEVSRIVSYPDPSVFTRAFSRWSSLPPGQWRSKHYPSVREHASSQV